MMPFVRRMGFALALLLGGCATPEGLRPDESVPSSVLRDAYFSKTRLVGGSYESDRHFGTPTRHVDPAQDTHLTFVIVLDRPNNEHTVAGELIRPDGKSHGQFQYVWPAKQLTPWQARSWTWAVAPMQPYPGEWHLRLHVDEQLMGRYYFRLSEAAPR
jgi:hypothetical protein